MLAALLLGVVIGGAVGAVFVVVMLVVVVLRPRFHCPDCGAPLPKFWWPPSLSNALRGFWPCPTCGCEVNRRGEKVEQPGLPQGRKE